MRSGHAGRDPGLVPGAWSGSGLDGRHGAARGNEIRSFGLLVIGSHDPNRFQAGDGTVVLEQLADMAGASLSRALPPKESA